MAQVFTGRVITQRKGVSGKEYDLTSAILNVALFLEKTRLCGEK